MDRFEFGTGYWMTDGVLVKITAQINDTGGATDNIIATQLTVRF